MHRLVSAGGYRGDAEVLRNGTAPSLRKPRAEGEVVKLPKADPQLSISLSDALEQAEVDQAVEASADARTLIAVQRVDRLPRVETREQVQHGGIRAKSLERRGIDEHHVGPVPFDEELGRTAVDGHCTARA